MPADLRPPLSLLVSYKIAEQTRRQAKSCYIVLRSTIRNDFLAALNYFAHNFIKIYHTLRTSPAKAAGVTDRLFEVSDLVAPMRSLRRGCLNRVLQLRFLCT